ncbi:unnamed protein product [Rangifer tarandus platyrhynchus]|uniref:Uncharacterized protein n=2 Tax=Rangifer tarandus platyrhynchus TaxID=3082113 RepID=A0ABN9A304_RANTA|nr:unnamed protein product [Rangifer tarandus platyrhynchus]CAI9713845.1 unnamed protein product [Rangifer tarandus platyrhynchus]
MREILKVHWDHWDAVFVKRHIEAEFLVRGISLIKSESEISILVMPKWERPGKEGGQQGRRLTFAAILPPLHHPPARPAGSLGLRRRPLKILRIGPQRLGTFSLENLEEPVPLISWPSRPPARAERSASSAMRRAFGSQSLEPAG